MTSAPNSTPSEKALELDRCEASRAYFINEFCIIQDPKTFKSFPFTLWDFQENVLNMWATERMSIILKARQIGISWLAGCYALHMALFKNNSNILIISQGEKEARGLLERIKFVFERLPDWMKQPIDQENLNLLRFKNPLSGFESKIEALPSTAKAGRSETASLVILDEWAFHPYAAKNYAAVEATVGDVAQIIGISTADGLGNFYHQTWQSAERGENGFHPLFLKYDCHPDRRDPDWWDKAYNSYNGEKKYFYQEYPRNPLEAFVTSGGCIFDLEGLQYLADELTESPIKLDSLRVRSDRLWALAEKGHVKVWRIPIRGQSYAIGADPAGGHGNDFSAAQIYDSTGEHCATVNVKMEPEDFAGLLATLGVIYNDALVTVERNNHGMVVLSHLREVLNYGNIYVYKRNRRTKQGDNRPGFPSNKLTKTQMNADLQTQIRTKGLSMYDIDFVHQAQSYVEHPSGKVGAEQGMNDDLVTATGLAHIGINSLHLARGSAKRRITQSTHFKARHRR